MQPGGLCRAIEHRVSGHRSLAAPLLAEVPVSNQVSQWTRRYRSRYTSCRTADLRTATLMRGARSVPNIVYAVRSSQTWPTRLFFVRISSSAALNECVHECHTMAATTAMLVPAVTPPPGVISNFEDPPSKAHIIHIVMSVCLGLVTLLVAVRIYTRACISKPLWWDDCKFSIMPSPLAKGSLHVSPERASSVWAFLRPRSFR